MLQLDLFDGQTPQRVAWLASQSYPWPLEPSQRFEHPLPGLVRDTRLSLLCTEHAAELRALERTE